MVPLRAKTNGAYGKVLAARIQKWAGARRASARIHATENIDWWYYLEFGVGPYELRPDPNGVFEDQWAAIWRVHKGALSFDVGGRHIITDRILAHPGIRAKSLIGDALPDIRQKAIDGLRAIARQLLDNPEALQSFATKAAADAKTIIVTSIQGKLGAPNRGEGSSAAQLFDEHTDIVTNE